MSEQNIAHEDNQPAVVQLAIRQLEAYNRGDIDAFCACYAEDVVVRDGDGQITMEGMEAFRERYNSLFEKFEVTGTISDRMTLHPHCIEHEHWVRKERATGDETQGQVLVRYSEKDGVIAKVQFLFPDKV